MSVAQFLQAVKATFETQYPKFEWNSFFLDHEVPARDDFLMRQREQNRRPEEAIANLLRAFGRM